MSVDRGARSTTKKGAQTKAHPMDFDRQRREATRRDGRFCVAMIGRERCGAVAHATAHVFRRWLCGPAADHADVVIRTCVECHDMLDGRIPNTKRVRFPLGAQRRAWDRIVSMCRETSTIGPRP